MTSTKLIRETFEKNEGILRLAPVFVPRRFSRAGRRLKLHPDDYYALGTKRGAKFGVYDVETPVMLRFGQLSADEYFVSEEAAKEGVRITNNSRFDNLVILKHFANNNPETPKTVPV